MTSLELFPEPPPSQGPLPNWGTGRHGPDKPWIPRAPTWHKTGIPLDHPYTVTSLTLSNVRDHDELVPPPQTVEINKKCINQPFPAEHPYASHIEQFALIPKFDSPEDPKRGVQARTVKPISSEMPANPYKVKVLKKTYGYPYREEIVTIPSEGKREALYWPGEQFFDQPSKIHGSRQQYYPAPPKLMVPNLQERPADQRISERTQNTLRNIERDQWTTSYKMHYTGLGPSNPLVLDNLDCKKAIFLETGEWDENLYPHFINTFDPARPLEGRLRKLFAPKRPEQILVEEQMLGGPSKIRKMTATEKAEEELLHGRDYVNFPDRCDIKQINVKLCQNQNQNQTKAEKCLSAAIKETAIDARPKSFAQAEKAKAKSHQEETKFDQAKTVQGLEACNRWKLLESATPSHDIVQLREKYKILNKKEMPNTFYQHEGQYNEERAGLYKTSYDPQQLAYSMNAQQLSGGVLFDTSMSHENASLYPTTLWDENEACLNGSKTIVFKNAELRGDCPNTSDVLNPYREHIAIQRSMLQPTVDLARPLTQEGKFMQKEDTYGDSYNTHKFLQDYKLHKNIRIEPRDLISHENQNLERTREVSSLRETAGAQGPLVSVHFSDEVNVRNMQQNIPVKIAESHILKLNAAEQNDLAEAFGHKQVTSLSYMQTHPERPESAGIIIGDIRNLAENLGPPTRIPTILERNKRLASKPQFVTFSRGPQDKVPPLSETADQFRKLSVSFLPPDLRPELPVRPSSANPVPVYDLGEKTDQRFQLQVGRGEFRPQSCLQELKDSFVKSEVHKRFHRMFPESNPDIRANFTTGQKDIELSGCFVTPLSC